MTSLMTDRFQIASGHDQSANLEALHEIDPPLFADYAPKGGQLTEWIIQMEPDGTGEPQPVGLPVVELRLFAVQPEERAALRDYIGNVTVRLYNKETAEWGNYNGKLTMPLSESKWAAGNGYWEEVKVTLYDLEALP